MKAAQLLIKKVVYSSMAIPLTYYQGYHVHTYVINDSVGVVITQDNQAGMQACAVYSQETNYK